MNTFKRITTERQTPPQAFAERAKEAGLSFVNFISAPLSEGLRHRGCATPCRITPSAPCVVLGSALLSLAHY